MSVCKFVTICMFCQQNAITVPTNAPDFVLETYSFDIMFQLPVFLFHNTGDGVVPCLLQTIDLSYAS